MPQLLHSEIRSAHRATLFRPFSCCNSVLIIKKHPRTADSIRDSHILSATIQEYSFTLFNLKVAVSGVVARAYDDHVGQVGDVNRVMLPTDMLSHWR